MLIIIPQFGITFSCDLDTVPYFLSDFPHLLWKLPFSPRNEKETYDNSSFIQKIIILVVYT